MFCDLSRKRALITGASRGIGKAIAIELAKSGADIVLHYANRAEQAEEVRNQILQLGRDCTLTHCDLSNAAQVSGWLPTLPDVDILVNNASVQISQDFTHIDADAFHAQIDCNLLTPILLIQRMLPYMQHKHWGRIVTIGSVQDVKPHPRMAVYAVTKSALANLVGNLAAQYSKFGITFNNIAPGVICTDRNREALEDAAYVEKLYDLIPSRRFAQPEECAGMVRLLCSNEGQYITGESIYIDGGKHL